MSVKKLLVLAAAAATATAFAGGSNSYTMASNNTNVSGAFSPYAYVDVNGGYDLTGVKNEAATGFKSFKSSGNAWTFGGDAGYMFMKNLGVELGGSYFTPVKGSGVNNGLKVKQYDIYLAAKMLVNVATNVDLFGKVGVDYHHINTNTAAFEATGTTSTYKTVNNFGPMFGAGVDYGFMPNWKATFQWRHLSSVTKYTDVVKLGMAAPSQNLFTLGVGYNFAM